MMLTAKLSGCTLVARAAGGGAEEVTHLHPTPETGLQLNNRINASGQSAYGSLWCGSDIRSINVIGVHHNNRWVIWAQKLEKNSNPPRLLSLNRIWV